MKLTKSKLKEIIREEIQKEAFGTTARYLGKLKKPIDYNEDDVISALIKQGINDKPRIVKFLSNLIKKLK